jgi:hypothetical protein
MPQCLAADLASDPHQHHRWPSLVTHADDADEAEGSLRFHPPKHPQLAKRSIVYRHAHEAALGASLWSTHIHSDI